MIMLSVMVAFIRLGRRIRLWWLIGGVAALLSISVLLDGLREPVFSLSQTIGTFGLKTLYGNSFSDIRDFALILSFWNGEHFLGLTYLAGIFAFIPRFLSPFRDTWALGVVTARMAGFLPTEHPGLRVGMFGRSVSQLRPARRHAAGVAVRRGFAPDGFEDETGGEAAAGHEHGPVRLSDGGRMEQRRGEQRGARGRCTRFS